MSLSVIIFVFAIVFNALANILMKVGMSRVGDTNGWKEMVIAAIKQPALFLGVLSFGLALAAYSFVLTRLNLSVAYPIMISVGLVIVVCVSYFFLNESISILQIVGFGLIILGVWFVAK